MDYAGRHVPRICATLDNRQSEHQSHMIEVEDMINKQPIEILINLGESHSYIDPNLVERFHLEISKHNHSWMVLLAIGTKRKISELVVFH